MRKNMAQARKALVLDCVKHSATRSTTNIPINSASRNYVSIFRYILWLLRKKNSPTVPIKSRKATTIIIIQTLGGEISAVNSKTCPMMTNDKQFYRIYQLIRQSTAQHRCLITQSPNGHAPGTAYS